VLANAVALLSARVSTVEDPEFAAELQILIAMLSFLAQEYDESSSSRVEEIGKLSDLLVRGATLSEGSLQWVAADQGAGRDLRISALDGCLDVLCGRLVELQAWLESQPGEEAAGLLQEILLHEYAVAKRRSHPFPGG
jgi:hypothetical protein